MESNHQVAQERDIHYYKKSNASAKNARLKQQKQ